MSKPEKSIGRRHLLTGAAAVGVGALTAAAVADSAAAEGAPPTGLGASGNESAESEPLGAESIPLPEALPPIAPGAKTKTISAWQMTTFGYAATSAATKYLAPGVDNDMSSSNDGQRLVAALSLEPGSIISRIDVYGRIASGSSSQSYFLAAYDVTTDDLSTVASGSTGVIAAGEWTRTLTPALTTQVGIDYFVTVATSTTQFVRGLIVQYLPPATTYVPVTPYRAYDSRLAGVPSPGILPRLTNRVVNVVNAIGPSGAVVTAGLIPTTARAITYNLTATGTTGDNFLSIAPGLAASTGVSSINFGANQSIANAATVSLDNGTVKVFCGDNVGSSHFILDVTGYYI